MNFLPYTMKPNIPKCCKVSLKSNPLAKCQENVYLPWAPYMRGKYFLSNSAAVISFNRLSRLVYRILWLTKSPAVSIHSHRLVSVGSNSLQLSSCFMTIRQSLNAFCTSVAHCLASALALKSMLLSLSSSSVQIWTLHEY